VTAQDVIFGIASVKPFPDMVVLAATQAANDDVQAKPLGPACRRRGRHARN